MNTENTALAATNRKTVYALQTHEPWVTRTDTMSEPPILYATREDAEKAAATYNKQFDDAEPATVMELEVNGQSDDGSDVAHHSIRGFGYRDNRSLPNLSIREKDMKMNMTIQEFATKFNTNNHDNLSLDEVATGEQCFEPTMWAITDKSTGRIVGEFYEAYGDSDELAHLSKLIDEGHSLSSLGWFIPISKEHFAESSCPPEFFSKLQDDYPPQAMSDWFSKENTRLRKLGLSLPEL